MDMWLYYTFNLVDNFNVILMLSDLPDKKIISSMPLADVTVPNSEES